MPDAPTTVLETTGPSASAPLPRRVLVANRDEQSRDRRRSQLHGSGYLVSVARTGFEAIVKACCQLPDLVLLDASLGDTEVAETARLLAGCPATAHIPVVRLGAGRRLLERVLASA